MILPFIPIQLSSSGLIILLGIPALYIAMVWRYRRQLQDRDPKLVLPSLLLLGNQVVPGAATPRQQRVRRFLRAISLVALVLALTDIHQLGEFEPPKQMGRPIVLVIDSSLTMTLEDLGGNTSINRMEATKLFLGQWVKDRPENAFGLIMFGSQAAVLSKPTTDTPFTQAQLNRIQVGTLGNDTALGDAIALAIREIDLFRSESRLTPSIVLVSDGEDSNSGAMDPLESVAIAKARGYPIHTLQFGRPSRPPDTHPSLYEISVLTGGQHWYISEINDLKAVITKLEQLTPTVSLPPVRSQGLWWTPWLVLAGVVSAVLSLFLARNRTRDVVDPELRLWAIQMPRQPLGERLREPIFSATGIALALIALLLLFQHDHKVQPREPGAQTPRFVVVFDLLDNATSHREAQRIAVLHLSQVVPSAEFAVVAVGTASGLAMPFTRDRAMLTRTLDLLVMHRDRLVSTSPTSAEATANQRRQALRDAEIYLSQQKSGAGHGAVLLASDLPVDKTAVQNRFAEFAGVSGSHLVSDAPVMVWQWLIVAALGGFALAWLPLGVITLPRRVAAVGIATGVFGVLAVFGISAPTTAATLSPPMTIPTGSDLGIDPLQQAFQRKFSEGLAQLQKSQAQAAVLTFSHALTLSAPQAQRATLFNLGLSLSHQGDYSAALPLWKHYLKQFPEDTQARSNLDFVQKRIAAQQAAQGRQTDLRGRRGQSAMGEIQTDGSGSNPADLETPAQSATPGAQSARELAAAFDSSRGQSAEKAKARAWPIDDSRISAAQHKVDRIEDASSALLDGLLRQSDWKQRRKTAREVP